MTTYGDLTQALELSKILTLAEGHTNAHVETALRMLYSFLFKPTVVSMESEEGRILKAKDFLETQRDTTTSFTRMMLHFTTWVGRPWETDAKLLRGPADQEDYHRLIKSQTLHPANGASSISTTPIHTQLIHDDKLDLLLHAVRLTAAWCETKETLEFLILQDGAKTEYILGRVKIDSGKMSINKSFASAKELYESLAELH